MKPGQFIKCLSLEHGQEMKEYFVSLGLVDEQDRFIISAYYGLSLEEGDFWCVYYLPEGCTEIQLPKDWRKPQRTYPREMIVWNNGSQIKQKYTVLFEAIGKYFTKGQDDNYYYDWDHAEDINFG